jgi:N-acetylmuramoyl-L-alanine amidase
MAKLVVLDPGHGGEDPGAGGHGLQEAVLTLKIAKRVRTALTDLFDVDVALTRSGNRFVSLDARAAFANERDADYFVAIHINSGGGTGYEDYVHDSAGPNSTSERRRNAVHKAVATFMGSKGMPDRGKKTANFAVLRETTMPAILTENLFIDTENNAGLLAQDSFLRGLAKAHAKGIGDALNLPRRPGSA